MRYLLAINIEQVRHEGHKDYKDFFFVPFSPCNHALEDSLFPWPWMEFKEKPQTLNSHIWMEKWQRHGVKEPEGWKDCHPCNQ